MQYFTTKQSTQWNGVDIYVELCSAIDQVLVCSRCEDEDKARVFTLLDRFVETMLESELGVDNG